MGTKQPVAVSQQQQPGPEPCSACSELSGPCLLKFPVGLQKGRELHGEKHSAHFGWLTVFIVWEHSCDCISGER